MTTTVVVTDGAANDDDDDDVMSVDYHRRWLCWLHFVTSPTCHVTYNIC